jgi:hypothetical protein
LDESELLNIFASAGLSRTNTVNAHYARVIRGQKTDLDADFSDFQTTLATLRRLGLVYGTSTMKFSDKIAKAKSVLTDPQIEMPQIITKPVYSISELCVGFVRACQAPTAEAESE